MDGLFRFVLLLAVLSALTFILKVFLPSIRELAGHWMLRLTLKSGLSSPYYTVFNNVPLPGRGGSHRIDHVVVSVYGIFVIAASHELGSIEGLMTDRRWTRTLFRSKRRFRNPLRRVEAQAGVLQGLLGVGSSCFHPMVVFTGNTRLKTKMPINVTQLGGMLPFIQVRSEKRLEYEQAAALSVRLETLCRRSGAHRPGPVASRAALGLVLVAALGFSAAHLLGGGGGPFNDSLPALATTPPNQAGSPFVSDADPPRVELPGARSADSPAIVQQGAMVCANSTDRRRCSCVESEGNKKGPAFGSCKDMANAGGPLTR
jgi:hypothetical protein